MVFLFTISDHATPVQCKLSAFLNTVSSHIIKSKRSTLIEYSILNQNWETTLINQRTRFETFTLPQSQSAWDVSIFARSSRGEGGASLKIKELAETPWKRKQSPPTAKVPGPDPKHVVCDTTLADGFWAMFTLTLYVAPVLSWWSPCLPNWSTTSCSCTFWVKGDTVLDTAPDSGFLRTLLTLPRCACPCATCAYKSWLQH